MKRFALLVVLVIAWGCGAHAPVSHVRFHAKPPVWKVNDRADVPKKPAERQFSHLLYFFDVFFFRQLTEAMDLEEPRRALNVNSYDEVPDSTWFTNRIGIRDITPEEIAVGANTSGQPVLPMTVKGTKVGGKSVGFIMKDARGEKYVVKFDEKGFPVMETAADVIMAKLLWAAGYNVPEDSIVHFSRDQLSLADGAEVKDTFGNARPMKEKDVDENLEKVNREPDGSYRALTSKFLSGIPIGGFAMRGVREDDPNDTIPHEHRREVRGLYVIYSWLQATDVKEDNTLDVWATDPKDENRHYVVHYLVDFGKSLGVNGTIPGYAPDGHAARVDILTWAKGFFTFGLYRRKWEGTYEPDIFGVGRIDGTHVAPEGYNPQQPYRPFEFVDRFDGYWAAKLIARFSPELIRSAVNQGQFDDPRAVDYLTETLLARREKVVRHWFRKVSPLDHFAVETNEGRTRLCFDDLMLVYNLDPLRTARTSWTATAFDYDGNALDWTQSAVRSADGTHTACVSGFPMGSSHDGYTILSIRAVRHDDPLPPVEVHISSAGDVAIVGIHRR